MGLHCTTPRSQPRQQLHEICAYMAGIHIICRLLAFSEESEVATDDVPNTINYITTL